MESFVHLRKGTTPRRLHADLDGLKDDELGRGGFTGRTANLYRRNDPTAYRSVGPLRPLDVLSTELKPSDATDAARRSAADVLQRRLPGLLSRRRRRCRSSPATSTATCCASCTGHRAVGDRVRAAGLPRGRLGLHPEGLHLAADPRRGNHAADDRGHRRVPRPATGTWGGTSRSTRPRPPSPNQRRSMTTARDEYEVRLIHRRAGRQRCSTNTIRSTSKAGAATTSRSPSISTTTTSSPPTACTCRRPCTCSCRPPGCT